MERRKYIVNVNRSYINKCSSQVVRIDEDNIKGYSALIQIEEVNRPFMAGELCLSDKGYSELAFMPDNENWMVWAMYDDQSKIIEWYFDITRKNSVDETGSPYCDDMYLDAALMPDGRIIILDEDELSDALDNGNITQAEFDTAYKVLNELIEKKIITVEYMEKFCSKLKEAFC